MREQTCCFIGHKQIPKTEIKILKRNLKKQIKKLIKKGYKNFICSGAMGFDTLVAQTVIELRNWYKDIRLSLVIPYTNQAEKWQEEDVLTYKEIISNADGIQVLSKIYYNGIIQVKNTYMIDNSNICIAYLRKPTGEIASAVNYTQNGEYCREIKCIML